ncbi:winged helix-turn-helix domain-containing protein, partial [Patescibacteria group bacterium]|nr:winged helix-turn-helix domain-containing protein [Patescibacteria group bacterium]
LDLDKRLKRTSEGFGLMSWRHINPKSIRDKAYIVLKRARKPLHFIEIANSITKAGFDKKIVTVQAVHNELIRYDQFVLVGRGLYGLKEFGYEKGTVADIIESLLKEKSPLTKQEIIDGVLAQRHVKKGTISLNLQKNTHFVRVGRAVYKLDLKKKKK